MGHDDWEAAAADWLSGLSSQSLRRSRRVVRAIDATHVEIDGQTLINFSSNDYLGLSHHADVIEASCEAVPRMDREREPRRWLPAKHRCMPKLKKRNLQFGSETESAVLLPSGYQANLAAVQTLTIVAERSGKSIRFLLDKLSHASLIDAVRASGAPYRVFPHNGMEKLERLLSEAEAEQIQIVVTESIFSMDGDVAPLKALSLLKLQYSFLLLLDEAHSSGVYGSGGRGLADELQINSPADVSVVTLSKAFGCGGGAVCGSQIFCDALINSARAYIFSTAVPPMVPGALIAGLRVMENEPGLQAQLRVSSRRVREEVAKLKFSPLPNPPPEYRGREKNGLGELANAGSDSPIIPIALGDELRTLQAADQLRSAGHLCIAIRPPTVAPGASRLRITLSAKHSDAEIDALLASLQELQQ